LAFFALKLLFPELELQLLDPTAVESKCCLGFYAFQAIMEKGVLPFQQLKCVGQIHARAIPMHDTIFWQIADIRQDILCRFCASLDAIVKCK